MGQGGALRDLHEQTVRAPASAVALVGAVLSLGACGGASGAPKSPATQSPATQSVPANASLCAVGHSGTTYVVIQGSNAGQDCNDILSKLGGGWTLASQLPSGIKNWNEACDYFTSRQNEAGVFFDQVGPAGLAASSACGNLNAAGWQENK